MINEAEYATSLSYANGLIQKQQKDIKTLQEQNNELIGDIQRIYERAEEAFADQPDHYALSIALTMIRKWSYERLNMVPR
jgi:hypothetical protein